MGKTSKQPFSNFGEALKQLRVSRKKSQLELSGAVEVDQLKLEAYELGAERPSEDILQLIIQHFNLRDEEARELWRLAGYNESPQDALFASNDEEAYQQKSVLVSQHDARIVYTDMVQVMVNNFGVILNFMQGAGPNNNPLAISRIGMSREHAKSVLELLKKTLEEAEGLQHNSQKPRQLMSGTNPTTEDK